jgi:tRNA 2-thiouridine synthesizing protein A
MTGPDRHDQQRRNVQALDDAQRITGTPCRACAVALCGHDAVFALVLGYKGAPRCLPCIAAHMHEPAADLRERAFDYVRHHECFLTAWHRAGEREGFGAVERPPCLWQGPAAAPPVPPDDAAPAPAARPAAADTWDAGDLACGDLVLDLRLRLRELPSGGVLDLRATDPGAPIDLPAWCTMTGHTLLEARHPNYRIRRK